MKIVLVVGSNGQLGKCIRKLASDYEFSFCFADSSDLDITDRDEVLHYFEEIKPDFCINAAAYTAVDMAEKEMDRAFSVNAQGVANLAEASSENGTVLIHISTDYVFDGETEISYTEDNFTNPLGVYGASKLRGEELALEANPKTIIIRTSWLYSEFNKNFVKTMLLLFPHKEEMGVVADQFGQPTNAHDLAEAIMKVIASERKKFGIFHFSNYPETSWYDFATKIAKFTGSGIRITPLTTAQYPTAAKRPRRSTMCLDKIEEVYNVEPRHWENSLQDCVGTIMETE